MVALDLSGEPRPTLDHASPILRHVGVLGIPIPQQNAQFTSRQGHPCVRGAGPPGEAALRQSLQTQPKALAVVEQEFQGGARAVAEDVDGALQRVVAQALSAYSTEPINAFAEIDRFDGDKDAALRGELF